METREQTLHKVSFCADLPDAAIADLAAIAVPLRRPARAFIQFEGDSAEAMYVIGQGHVKIARTAANGREQVLYVLGPGSHFNTVPIFDEGACPANAQALTDVLLLMLPRDAMRRVVERHPPLALALLKEFTGRVRHMVNLVDELALHTVQGRLAGLLLAQAEVTKRGVTAPALTQAEMAAHLGTVREMVGRTLKTFEALGLIRVERGQITILDRTGLEAQREE
jgi:CRP/FNR family transcriptional regulator, cyclic AMP receptor protein